MKKIFFLLLMFSAGSGLYLTATAPAQEEVIFPEGQPADAEIAPAGEPLPDAGLVPPAVGNEPVPPPSPDFTQPAPESFPQPFPESFSNEADPNPPTQPSDSGIVTVPPVQNTGPAELNEISISNDKQSANKAPRGPIQEIDEDIIVDVLELKNMDIIDILKLLSQKSGLNIVAGSGVQGKVTIYLKDVLLKDTLYIILDANDLAYKVEDGIVRVMPAREFEQRYGYKFGGKIQTRILRLSYAEVPDVVAILNQMKSPSGKIIFDAKSGTVVILDSSDKIRDMEELITEVDVPIAVEVFELSYAKAKDVSAKVSEMLTKNVGSMRFDEISNKIVVKDSPLKIKEIKDMIFAFDVKRREVLIEAKIVQIVLSDDHKFGVDWEAILRDYHNLDLISDFDVLSSTSKKGKVSIGTIATDDYTALIEALETVGATNILSSPRITALNNEEAKILVGSTEPYVTTTTTTPASGPTTTAESVNFIDVGVKLYVTPTVHKDDFITMKIKPEVSSVTRSLTTSQNNTIPIVETSEAETVVMVKDGITIVIGGLIKEENIESVNKIPFLGDIPLLGLAFRNSSSEVSKTEIAIFLTPKIVTGDIDVDAEGEPIASADSDFYYDTP